MSLQTAAPVSTKTSSWRAATIVSTRCTWKAATRRAILTVSRVELRRGRFVSPPRQPTMNNLWPWLVLFGLGAFHGLNPGMGWLFAVALGLQEQRRSAVWRALPPIALGHALSVAAIIGLVL